MKTTFKRKAFTLIELLIVIAIIGILFIVLVSKVDFATDKAKTTGVQTDFRSFQMAFETVSRENAGFNTLGWDTGDIKRTDFNTAFPGYSYNNELVDAGDGVRNSYDVGDKNFNGEMDENETWTGRKVYTETWTGIYTLTHPLNENDTSAYLKLEEAINKNLDPKLHITINPDTKEITMSNGYQDPWKTEYHGFYLSNAAVDGKDRGAILMYSDGPNKQFGSAQVIANGVVTIGVPKNNIQGQDDLSILTIYTYFNGYGEVKTTTTGFSQNQQSLPSNIEINTQNGIPSVEQLQAMYDFTYYSSIESAVSDIKAGNLNNGTSNKNAIGVYTDENGKPCVVLLENHAVAHQVVINFDCTINLGGKKLTGAANGLIQVDSGNVVIDGRLPGSSIIVTATETVKYLRCIRLLGGNTTVLGGTYIGYGDYSGTIGTQGISVGSTASATLENCYAYGTHVGVQVNSSVVVNGGTYEGYGHGGFYISGSGKSSYIRNATIREAPMPEGYVDLGGGDNNSAMYIGGTGGKQNISVYIDNCNFFGTHQSIVLRGTSGEKNSSLYISNSTINLDYVTAGIRVDNDTHSVFLGTGNNFAKSNCQRQYRVTETNETYTKPN